MPAKPHRNPPSSCETLRSAQASLRRGWAALQSVRSILEGFAVVEVPEPQAGKCFEEEGAILAQALLETLRRLHVELHELEEAVEAVRPFLTNPKSDAAFPHALMRLNRAAHKDTHLSKEALQQRLAELGKLGRIPPH